MVNVFNGRPIKQGQSGKMKLSNISQVLKELEELLGEGENAQRLMSIFQSAYSSENLSQASRIIINELFKEDGLLILEGDDPLLKSIFVDVMKKNIIDHAFYPLFKDQTDLFCPKQYHAQAISKSKLF